MTAATAAFYCVADARYFLGAVAMINSLRLHGHDEPVYLLDCGLRSGQRELLAGEVNFVEAPAGVEPWLAKTIAPLRHPAETMVLIDVDMIVTRPLGELIATAAGDRIVAFRDNLDRHVDEWGRLLGLGANTRGPYLSSGFLALSRDPDLQLLELFGECCREVDFERTYWRDNDPLYPFLYADQDVLNAVLQTGGRGARLVALDRRLQAAIPFGAPAILDEDALSCAYEDGTEPYVIHHILARKPWLERAHHGTYSRFLTRALSGPGLRIDVPAAAIPLRLRGGTFARLERGRIEARDRAGWLVRNHLPEAVRAGLDRRRAQRNRP